MDAIPNRQQRRWLEKQNRRRPAVLEAIPRALWLDDLGQLAVLRSRDFLVQVFIEKNGILRLSVNRTTMQGNGRWAEGITWDDLMRLKREAGYGDAFAVEVYPEDKHVVDVASMRHLWVLPERLPFAWRRGQA